MPDEHPPAGARARARAPPRRPNVARIEAMWSDCRARHGGPFLFGKFCAADAMYAPVVTRLHTYGIKVSRETLGYMEAMMALPALAEWRAGVARRELDRRRGRGRLADGAVTACLDRPAAAASATRSSSIMSAISSPIWRRRARSSSGSAFASRSINVQTNADASGALKPSGTSNRLARLQVRLSRDPRRDPRHAARGAVQAADRALCRACT